ncbi:hypothetical protein CBR_g23399 [Chara braunii]|uniref:Phosphoglycerate mutase-like protein n=1 Tax=Chara braunii TaxID=69332 RepID=A0A388L4E7_CHABU|nr:hypothetical protein CBR_g23399 [Chara braunii]|eukprot:GBG77073.1 hypothetical protein CBR_g23399 [Chara braunii]
MMMTMTTTTSSSNTSNSSAQNDKKSLDLHLLSRSKIIHLIRHGQARHNVAGKSDYANYRKWEYFDSALTEEGWEQAAMLWKTKGRELESAELVVVSPLTRTLETAMAIYGVEEGEKLVSLTGMEFQTAEGKGLVINDTTEAAAMASSSLFPLEGAAAMAPSPFSMAAMASSPSPVPAMAASIPSPLPAMASSPSPLPAMASSPSLLPAMASSPYPRPAMASSMASSPSPVPAVASSPSPVPATSSSSSPVPAMASSPSSVPAMGSNCYATAVSEEREGGGGGGGGARVGGEGGNGSHHIRERKKMGKKVFVGTTRPFVSVELCRERLGRHPCDSRAAIAEYRRRFRFVDFTQIETDEDTWWTDDHRETESEIGARALKFLTWLAQRKEMKIAVISHAAFLAALVKLFGDECSPKVQEELRAVFANCEMRSVVLLDRGSDGSGDGSAE